MWKRGDWFQCFKIFRSTQKKFWKSFQMFMKWLIPGRGSKIFDKPEVWRELLNKWNDIYLGLSPSFGLEKSWMNNSTYREIQSQTNL